MLTLFIPNGELEFSGKNTREQLHLLQQVGKADLSVARIYEGHLNALFLNLPIRNRTSKKALV